MLTRKITQLSAPADLEAQWFGYRYGNRGTHSSRTIMFHELEQLLRASPPAIDVAGFRRLVIEENYLGKKTAATRRLTMQRLCELYGMDPALPLFRVLRRLWNADPRGRAMLALLVAFARDPLLRLASSAATNTAIGYPYTAAEIDTALARALGTRLNPSVRNKVARNVASSLTQAGLLAGHVKKIRSQPVVSPASTTLALLLGYVLGLRGPGLFSTDVTRLLGRSNPELISLARMASRQGLLSFRQLGDVIDISFPELLTPEEEDKSHGRV